MNMDAQTPGRWIGLLLVGALTLGACGSGTETPTAALVDDTSDGATELALVDDAAEAPSDEMTEPVEAEPVETVSEPIDLEGVESLDDLDGVPMTEELFEAMRSSEVMRPVLLEEMVAQGLTEDEAVCFFDNVSPGLFVVFGEGDAPDDEQFAELMDLLVTCDITFAAAPS